MTDRERNDEYIREFLSRGPVVHVEIHVPPYLLDSNAPPPKEPVLLDASAIQVKADIRYDERDNPSFPSRAAPTRIHIRGTDEEYLTPELRGKIDEYLVHCLSPVLGQRLDEAMLRQSIDICSAFFEGLTIAGIVKAYHVYFDLEHSSHRTRSIAYLINVEPVDGEIWKGQAAIWWDHFVAIITDPRSATIASNLPELVVRWGRFVLERL